MRSLSIPLALTTLLLATGHARSQQADPAASVDGEKLKAHVSYLASPELEGRRAGPGLEKARRYVADAFRRAGLRPFHDP